MKLKLSLLSFGLALVFAVLLYTSATALTPEYEGPPTWNEDLPVLGGCWLFDEVDQEWWYVHSIDEFDAPMETCNTCHIGQDSFFDKTWICPWKDYDA